jgi:hypothetical protein
VREKELCFKNGYVLGTVKFLIMTLPNEKRVTGDIGIVLLTTHTGKHPLPRSIPSIAFDFFPSPMEDRRFYEEDDWYFQFQDFRYTLSPGLVPAMNISKDFFFLSV